MRMGKIQKLEPNGFCKMGDEVSPVYILRKKKWFSEKVIERVLTGRNCHNRLGQETDPNNHSQIFDCKAGEMVKIISEAGVKNYLKRARIVGDDKRKLFYDSVKTISDTKPEIIVEEPLQPRLDLLPYVKIERLADGGLHISFDNAKADDDKRKEAISMLSEAIKILL